MRIVTRTAERLREVLAYDPGTGVFTWRLRISSHSVVGRRAGTRKPPKNYVCIGIDGKRYYAHRLAWLYMTGMWPACDIDHHNLVHDDNRWKNLRPASPSQNRCNQRPRRDNRLGLKGVFFHAARRKWYARITKDHRTHHLGVFETADDARTA